MKKGQVWAQARDRSPFNFGNVPTMSEGNQALNKVKGVGSPPSAPIYERVSILKFISECEGVSKLHAESVWFLIKNGTRNRFLVPF